MKRHCRITVFVVILCLLLTNTRPALALPPMPSSFWGTVRIGGASVPLPGTVKARINGVQYAFTGVIESSGQTYYSLDVPGDDPATAGVIEGGVSGDMVVFYVNDQVADQSASWVGSTNVHLNLTAPAPSTHTISGNAGVASATLSYDNGGPQTATADGDGAYSFAVPHNWSGTVTPSKTGYTFSPTNLNYYNVTADQTGQDYNATLITFTITGNAGTAGAVLNYVYPYATLKTVTADGSSHYSITIPYGWSGIVTPSKVGYTFSPVSRPYTNVTADQTNQNYTTAAGVQHPKADFDADSQSDIGYFHAATGQWAALHSGDAFSYAAPQFITWGQTGDIVVPGDYDGDRLLDPTVRRPPTGGQSAAYLILRSSTGYDYGATLVIPAGWPGLGDTPVPADYNGDGRTDAAIWRGNSGAWIIALSPSFSSLQFASWGVTGDKPFGTDVDGDGKADIGYFRPSTGVWAFLLSTENYNYGRPVFFSWGASADIPVMADYDGDGMADPAVVIPPSGGQSRAYRILRSSTSYDPGQTWTIPAGWPGLGDTPVPLDYDGDGKADAGIWRANTGVWIIPKSSTSNTSYIFAAWGESGDQVIR